RGPGRRLLLGREVEDDADAERDGKPRHEPARRDICLRPVAQALGKAAPQLRKARRPRQRRPAAGSPGPPYLHAAARAARSRHDADFPPAVRVAGLGYTNGDACAGRFRTLWRIGKGPLAAREFQDFAAETLAHVSRRPTVRLKTSRPGLESGSRQ